MEWFCFSRQQSRPHLPNAKVSKKDWITLTFLVYYGAIVVLVVIFDFFCKFHIHITVSFFSENKLLS